MTIRSRMLFPGLGPAFIPTSKHKDAPARGGSAIEASKIAGYATVNMTGGYTVVQLSRQEELTRAIQERRARVAEKREENASLNAITAVEAA